ncbi:MAG: hypothetical protein DWQ07_22135 [Chloroflexi bacterium]|nr:MAG: hypothetical protein DWQ07_22135 [Chloroflexota bacterium]MBL1196345.1 hypothetical protein [Chloroflexota bacterium]NOH13640.1 hypothetical protein [Chloroflexota bacterium]
MGSLEQQFHQAMAVIYETAKAECQYNATYFLQMLAEYGGVETAKRLLSTEKPSEGFTKLWECERLDLTVEAHVINDEFSSLFTTEECNIARARLLEYGHTL